MLFARWLRQKKIDISEAGLKKMDKDGNINLADYIHLSIKSTRLRDELNIYGDDGAAIWQALVTQYDHHTYAERARLQALIQDVRLTEDGNIDSYIANKMKYIHRLIEGGEQWEEERIIVELLRGLPAGYNPVRTSVETRRRLSLSAGSTSTALGVEDVKRMLRDQAEILKTSEEVEIANAVWAQKKRRQGRKAAVHRSHTRERTCWNCGKTGHVKHNCPDIECHKCHQKGHMAKACTSKGEDAYAVQGCTYQEIEPYVENNTEVRQRQQMEHAFAEGEAKLSMEALAVIKRNDGWLIDSGTSKHMTPRKHLFVEYDNTARGYVSVANKQTLKIEGQGKIMLRCPTTDGAVTNIVVQALHVPGLAYNLFSTDQLVADKGLVVLSEEPYMQLSDGTHVELQRWSPRTMLVQAHETCMTAQQWHERLGHVNKKAAREVAKQLHIALTNKNAEKCLPCLLGKAKKTVIPKKSERRVQHPLDLVSVDAAGPLPTSIDGHRYLFLYVSADGGLLWPYFTKDKKQFSQTLKPFVAEVGAKPKCMRSDGASELVAGEFRKVVIDLGIRRERTTRASPQQNGQCERKIAVLISDARTILIDAEMPTAYWTYAVSMAAATRNITTIERCKDENKRAVYREVCRVPPIELLRRPFAQAVVQDPRAKERGKLEARGCVMTFVGYEKGMKGWRFINPKTRQRVCSRDAVFLEDKDGGELLEAREPRAYEYEDLEATEEDATVSGNDSNEEEDEHVMPEVIFDTPQEPTQMIDTPTEEAVSEQDDGPIPIDQPISIPVQIPTSDSDAPDDGGFGLDLGWDELDDECMDDLSLHEAHAQVARYSMDALSAREQEESHSKTTNRAEVSCYAETPRNYEEAVSSANAARWKEAIAEELANHEAYGTWKLVPRERARGKVLTNGWTFVTKLSQDGQSLRYKARLFVRGCQQTADQYEEVSAPVTTITTLRLLLHRVVTHEWVVKHVDVKAAYLNAGLKESIYMEVPQGVHIGKSGNVVCELKKSLYGLKQAGFNWNGLVHATLTEHGFEKSEIDHALYFLKGGKMEQFAKDKRTSLHMADPDAVVAVITVWVDDIVMAAKDGNILKGLVRMFEDRYTIKCTDLSVYLSQRIQWNNIGRNAGNDSAPAVTIDQEEYIKKVVVDSGMHESNQSRNPNLRAVDKRTSTMDVTEYRCIVGKVLWIQRTARPDITYPVMRVCSKVAKPDKIGTAELKKILRYLNATRSAGLPIYKGGELIAFVDSDWAGDAVDRRSVTGYVIGYSNKGGGFTPIIWRSVKQSCVATSSCEAEYVAMHDVCKEVAYLRNILKEVGWLDDAPTVIYGDNASAIAIGNDTCTKARRSRFIDIRYHYARWCAQQGIVRFEWISSRANIADMFTKGLKTDVFVDHAQHLVSTAGSTS